MIGYIGGHGVSTIYHNDTYYRISSENDASIKSIVFISKSFLNIMIDPETENVSYGNFILNPKKLFQDLNNLFSC